MSLDPTAVATAGLSELGSLASGFIQRRWALKDWHRQNEYNSPKNQVKRNREAGLPLAAMFSGGVSSQSDAPRATQLDPSLGTAKALEQYQSTALMRKQLQLLDEEIGIKHAEKIIKQADANRAYDEDRYYHQNTGTDMGDGLTEIKTGNRRMDSLDMEMRTKKALTETKEILARLTEAKTNAEIQHILMTIRLGGQQVAYNDVMQLVDKITVDKLKDNGGISGIEAMLYNFFIKKGSINPIK